MQVTNITIHEKVKVKRISNCFTVLPQYKFKQQRYKSLLQLCDEKMGWKCLLKLNKIQLLPIKLKYDYVVYAIVARLSLDWSFMSFTTPLVHKIIFLVR